MDADVQTPTISQILRSYSFRVCVYAVVALLVSYVTYLAIGVYGAHLMGAENGPIETAQIVLAVFSAVCAFCAALWSRIGRAGLVTAGAAVAYAAARESDQILETLLFDDAYKWVVGLPMAGLAVVTVIADRRGLIGETMWLMRQPAATLFAVAGVYLCFVCQFFDRPEMWSGISNTTEVATTKAVVEEFAELFAYLLLACSGLESAILARQGRVAALERSEEEAYPRIAA